MGACFSRSFPSAIPNLMVSSPTVSELYRGKKALHVCPKIPNLAPHLGRSTHTHARDDDARARAAGTSASTAVALSLLILRCCAALCWIGSAMPRHRASFFLAQAMTGLWEAKGTQDMEGEDAETFVLKVSRDGTIEGRSVSTSADDEDRFRMTGKVEGMVFYVDQVYDRDGSITHWQANVGHDARHLRDGRWSGEANGQFHALWLRSAETREEDHRPPALDDSSHTFESNTHTATATHPPTMSFARTDGGPAYTMLVGDSPAIDDSVPTSDDEHTLLATDRAVSDDISVEVTEFDSVETSPLQVGAKNLPSDACDSDPQRARTDATDRSSRQRKSCAEVLATVWPHARKPVKLIFARTIPQTVLGMQAVLAALIITRDGWVKLLVGGFVVCGVLSCIGLLPIYLVHKETMRIQVVTWVWASLLTVVPAALMAPADEVAYDAGALLGAAATVCFVLALWSLGWAFLWYKAPDIRPVQPNQCMLDMPPAWLLRLKFISVAGECYNYCGFSFFPALPWKAMEVPPSMPNPQGIMLAGFFEFGHDVNVHFWMFIGAAMLVVLAFVLLGSSEDPSARFAVVQLFFELMCFPLIKKLTGVLSCTSAKVWSKGNSPALSPFCDVKTVPRHAQCMDTEPSTVCWTSSTHQHYLAIVIVLLVPYYLACLHLQATAYERQSALIIDSAWSIISTQAKLMLAIIASSFGDCYPIVMVVSVQLVVVSQLLLLRNGTIYSNVLSLNAIRVAGLLCACANGMFAIFTLWIYRDDPAGASSCSRGEALGSVSSGSRQAAKVQLVSDYNTFYALVVANLAAVGLGFAWYAQVRDTWKSGTSTYPNLASINLSRDSNEVDYTIVKSRLDAAKKLVKKLERTKGFVFDLFTFEHDNGQQLEQVTLDMVLDSQEEFTVRLRDVSLTEKSGLMVLERFRTMQDGGVSSWKTCWLPCCASRYGNRRPITAIQFSSGANLSEGTVGLRKFEEMCDALKSTKIASVDLSGTSLGPTGLRYLLDYVREATAAVARLILDENPLTGGRWDSGFDKDITGVVSLCDTLKTSSVTELSLAKCQLGPGSLGKLAEYVREAEAAVNCLTLDMNGIFGELYSDGDVKEADKFAGDCDAFLAALKGSNIVTLSLQKTGIGPVTLQKLATSLPAALNLLTVTSTGDQYDPQTYTLTAGEEKIDMSNKKLGPADIQLLSAWLATPAAAAVARLILDENPLTCGTRSSDFDKDITGVVNLCDTLKTSSVTELSLAKCRLGPDSLGKLAEYVRDAEAAINSVTVDSTGYTTDWRGDWRNGGPKTYTLTAGEEHLELSSKNLGPADVTLVAAWLTTSAGATIARLILNDNPLTGGRYNSDYDTDITAVSALFDILKTSYVTELSLANCRLGPGSLGKLAEYVHEAEATLTSINCLANYHSSFHEL
eukprot:COSAG02_NODE_4698_length_5082_cov_4.415412_2_plen_1410_part_00